MAAAPRQPNAPSLWIASAETHASLDAGRLKGAPRRRIVLRRERVHRGGEAAWNGKGLCFTRFGGVFAQRGHSANYYGDYPGNNPENHPDEAALGGPSSKAAGRCWLRATRGRTCETCYALCAFKSPEARSRVRCLAQ